MNSFSPNWCYYRIISPGSKTDTTQGWPLFVESRLLCSQADKLLQGAVKVLENTALWGLPTKVVRIESFGAMVPQNFLRAFDGLPTKSSTVIGIFHSRQASLPTMPLTNSVLQVPISCCFLCLECPLSPLSVCMLSRFYCV